MKLKEFLTLNIILPLAESLQGTNATKWYKKIKDMNTWSASQIKEWQNAELKKFVEHAYNHTIYYRTLFDQIGIKPHDIQCGEDLKKLPVLTKDVIRSRYAEFLPDNLSNYKFRNDKTGGSTGEPMKYLCDENTWGYVTAAKIFYWKKTEYQYGDKFIALGSSSILALKPSFKRRIYDLIRGEIAMNCMGMDNDICAHYISIIKKKKIQFIYGYASSIYIFAKYVKQNHIKFPKRIKAVFTTSENLLKSYRVLIENAFDCKVMDCYGSRDAGITGYQNVDSNYEVGYNTIVEINNNKVLSTNILNYCFPLIRYDFGDCARLSNSHTYNGVAFSEIYGRDSDVIKLDNGRTLTPPGFTILMNKFDIAAFQIEKKSGTEIIVRIQKNEGFTKQHQEILLEEIKRFAGNNCTVYLEIIPKFEQHKNGKRRFFLN